MLICKCKVKYFTDFLLSAILKTLHVFKNMWKTRGPSVQFSSRASFVLFFHYIDFPFEIFWPRGRGLISSVRNLDFRFICEGRYVLFEKSYSRVLERMNQKLNIDINSSSFSTLVYEVGITICLIWNIFLPLGYIFRGDYERSFEQMKLFTFVGNSDSLPVKYFGTLVVETPYH